MKTTSKKPKKTKGLGAGIIAFGVVFALYSSVFHPHSLGGYILAFALSGLFGAIFRVMGQGLDLSTPEKEPESLKNMASDTGNPDVDTLLNKGREMILEIREENRLIPDASLTAKLDQLEQLLGQVFRTVAEKPTKAPQIRKFMDYYLPTTLKMVKGYRTLSERNRAGEDTAAARPRIDEALGVVLKGCQKMLDNLYRDDVLDITTDIDVLEQMLKRDGLTESDLERAANQARQAARIDQAVNRAAQERTAQQVPGQQSMPQQATQPSQAMPQVPVLRMPTPNTTQQGGQAMAQAPEKSE